MMIKQFTTAISALLLTTLSISATAHTIEPDMLFDKHTTVHIMQVDDARDNSETVHIIPFNVILGHEDSRNQIQSKSGRMNRMNQHVESRSLNLQKGHNISWREAYDNMFRNINSMMKHKGYGRLEQMRSVAEITTDRFNGICIFRLYF